MSPKKSRKKKFKLRVGRKTLDLSVKTCIMGIINRTPDSFSKDGLYLDDKKTLEKAAGFVKEGADILDVGGQSTRPGSRPVPVEEEIKRVIPIIKKIKARFDIPVSIDTTRSRVAELALHAGADIVNDISGLEADPEMAGVVARHKAAIVLMHCKGTPETMQKDPRYADAVKEIMLSLRKSIKKAEKAGISRDRIIVDPGIGFGKTVLHNLQVLKHLDRFKKLGMPLLIGTSRKSFIGKTLGLEVLDRKFGTAASVAWAISKGANIIRVHDVREMAQVSDLVDAIMHS